MIIAIDYLGCGRFRSESGVVTIKIVHYYAYHLSRNHCRQSKVAPEKKNIPGCKFRSTLPRHSTPKCIINPSLTDRRLKMRDQIPDQWYYWRVWWNVNREISDVTRVTSIMIEIITFIWETYELRIINSTSNEFNLISLPGIIRPCIDINDDNK